MKFLAEAALHNSKKMQSRAQRCKQKTREEKKSKQKTREEIVAKVSKGH